MIDKITHILVQIFCFFNLLETPTSINRFEQEKFTQFIEEEVLYSSSFLFLHHDYINKGPISTPQETHLHLLEIPIQKKMKFCFMYKTPSSNQRQEGKLVILKTNLESNCHLLYSETLLKESRNLYILDHILNMNIHLTNHKRYQTRIKKERFSLPPHHLSFFGHQRGETFLISFPLFNHQSPTKPNKNSSPLNHKKILPGLELYSPKYFSHINRKKTHHYDYYTCDIKGQIFYQVSKNTQHCGRHLENACVRHKKKDQALVFERDYDQYVFCKKKLLPFCKKGKITCL